MVVCQAGFPGRRRFETRGSDWTMNWNLAHAMGLAVLIGIASYTIWTVVDWVRFMHLLKKSSKASNVRLQRKLGNVEHLKKR